MSRIQVQEAAHTINISNHVTQDVTLQRWMQAKMIFDKRLLKNCKIILKLEIIIKNFVKFRLFLLLLYNFWTKILWLASSERRLSWSMMELPLSELSAKIGHLFDSRHGIMAETWGTTSSHWWLMVLIYLRSNFPQGLAVALQHTVWAFRQPISTPQLLGDWSTPSCLRRPLMTSLFAHMFYLFIVDLFFLLLFFPKILLLFTSLYPKPPFFHI